ncbi:glutathione peroxidase [Croceicoccus sp. F390]|uniref:Glutathione peroxidase n=1 Tax=Croceicoccus esteveae TaxID=3075597 RepID=A0ABU2ZET1_9SPHN|nr:glutathione peroxidase [Croceicoccus sp. F390]MDT0574593.1 glutathione peroxidase [Croceicoccus sp. F390]
MTERLPDLSLTRNDGTPDSVGAHEGKVLLIVNTASQCGLTPQYAGLKALQDRFGEQGFSVLAFPANDFGAQEPGTDAQIAQFCQTQFDVNFPVFAKASVAGADKQPLYKALIAARPAKQGDTDGMRKMLESHGIATNSDPEVLWNFEKFIVARDGRVLERFAPSTAPDDAALIDVIEAALRE